MQFSMALERAALDPEYRRRLKETPREALLELGVEVPDSLTLVVAEDTADTVHLVLPADDWAEMPGWQEVDRAAPQWGMSVCSATNSCCCNNIADPSEDEPTTLAA